ncbi:chemotaxis protein MotB [Microbacterium testaceum]|uniref:OmpA/MotB family protein n=1 Tax=Microbacterium TaxID=33882 RepID=UPI001AE8DBB7|nr:MULTISPECIES: flagellar motor protein MotB [Microbacterium]MDQ1113079.1 chemotaxis protein MotB [Microbacterium testaceum]MDQ1177211.1 chemotaxis protein MotB [Microbacterium sp. SORGH_AS_0421]MDR6096383.1 chemotaxis protein MotB [Microbacterium sp. SORGH_AS_0454]
MSSRRPARGRGHDEGEHDEPDERWAVSYSDMVTVLMCLFIVLYAVSIVDETKYEQLKNGLAEAFGQSQTPGGGDFTEGLVIPPELLAEEGVEDVAVRAARERDNLEQMKQQITSALAAQGLAETVDFVIDERGLKVGLVGAETFFTDNRTDLSAKADAVLDAVGDVLAAAGNPLSIEGHADHRAAVAPYESNWELSSGRATKVARFLVEHEGITGSRVQAVGYSDQRPLVEGDTAEDLAANRRVDIVVQSTEEEKVRALIPGLVQTAPQG